MKTSLVPLTAFAFHSVSGYAWSCSPTLVDITKAVSEGQLVVPDGWPHLHTWLTNTLHRGL
ncbi:MAG: hypothetical protein H6740_07590 [Alphaproteobacteria bacterium]|nr:hypothetical protein [Alphaproteobacteria bacterium]